MTMKSLKMLISSAIFFMSTITLIGITTYAWFMITNVNQTSLISQVSEIEAEYEFYRFEDSWHNGNPEPQLLEQTCSINSTDQCYQYIPNPTEMFELEESVSPGERFSFAIKITSLGNEAYLDLNLGRISSINVPTGGMAIQEAFYVEVTQVSYILDGVEGNDQKDIEPIVYYTSYFDGDSETIYPLIHHVPMNRVEASEVMIVIYFDICFDANVMGVDSLGIPYENQNHLAGQAIAIEDIYMMINPSLS